ncbi:Gfo/Idh/MocA family protein [Phytoactinopolyspora halotolerans]|uniref:Gfo/Idh/MocA family oxidoreductase n=1 Tax=Phytoactinopolyspora halotolerans TaxID=1981512 RepID=A0A6L9SD07_9ACTN|nr:Gfo/Idh/MocA family oxidoreductase [Phytoactinopolyspora halotolerans]NEE02909.1 Gfo/Idh/MocA family oxidoreductase [Phytoactinopolyspora halotolerans]
MSAASSNARGDVLRVGVIGAEHIHHPDHVRAIREHPRSELAGVVGGEESSEAARRLLDSVDAVVVNGRTRDHSAVIEAILSWRLPLFVEKPLAPSPAEARRLADRIDAAGVPFSTGYFLRQQPAVRRLKDIVRDAETRQPAASMMLTLAHPLELGDTFDKPPYDWMRDPGSGGTGAFEDLAIHLVDLLHWVDPGKPVQPGSVSLNAPPSRTVDVGGRAELTWGLTPVILQASSVSAPGGLHVRAVTAAGRLTLRDGELRVGDTVEVDAPSPDAADAVTQFLDDLTGFPSGDGPSTGDCVRSISTLADLMNTRR